MHIHTEQGCSSGRKSTNMSKREAFLDSVRKENVEDFLHLIKLHKERTDPFDIGEVVEELPAEQRDTLWSRLDTLLEQVLADVPPERWTLAPGQEVAGEDGMEVDDVSADRTHVMSVVDGVTLVATLSINVLQDGDAYKALLGCADRLHDVLSSLPVSDESLYLHILKLFEAWWKKGLKKKEKFGRTAFLISLQKSVTAKRSGAEIQRLWALHNVLLGLDFTSEDNKQMKDLLLQCFLNVNYINHDDGQRFLVFLFSWHVNFIWMIHGTIKNQLNFFSKNVTAHIADIYFRAWKKASGDFLEEIESACIQDLMKHAILLPRASPVNKKVLQILLCFHSRKTVPNVDEMLYKLYKPILWRALSAPNFEVRTNATFLFTDAFAIHDPSQSSEKIDKTIQKQLDILMSLLDDVHPLVRSTATLGVCKILAKFWEVLPPAVIADFMKKLLSELANDSSSPDVRGSVLKCVAIILDNPLSHPLMEQLLPALKYSIHDKSEKVRVAFLDLLIKVKAARAVKFWDVCNMEHLLARLGSDSPPVSRRIVNLVFKSFFPVNEPEKVWAVRCVSFLQTNRKAARKFYQYAHLYTAPTNIVKLMLAIRRILNKCVEVHGDVSELNETNKENSIGENPLSVENQTLVAGLLEVVVILWKSVQKALEKNIESKTYIAGKFSRVMVKYFHVFTDEPCTIGLTFLASLMPPAAVPTFSCGVLSRLRRMEPGAVPSDYSHIIDCVCGWGQARDIIELITDWLTKALSNKTAGKDDNRHTVRIQETEEAKPELALAYLEYMLSRKSTREGLILNHGPLKQLHKVLEAWRSVLYAHLSSAETDPGYPTVETALKALALHGRLSIHLQHDVSEGRDYLQSVEHMASWVTERVLPFLACHNEGDDTEPDTQLDLARQIVEIFVTVCRDAILVLGDEEFKFQILHLCTGILQSEKGFLCVSLLLSVLKEVARTDVHEASEEQEDPATVTLGVVASIFQKIVELLSRRLRKDPEGGKELCDSAVPGLADFLQVVQSCEGKPSNPLNDIFSTVFAAVIVESQYVLQKISHPEGVTVPETVEELRPLSGVLLTAVLKAPDVTRAFLTEIDKFLESEPIDSLIELAAVLHILSVISHTGKFKAGLKSAALSLHRRLQKHSAITANQDGDIPRAIYASAVKKLNDILDIQSSL